MCKNHFYISYFGNKRNEINQIYEHLNFDNTKIIIEPFCGSCAISYHIWLKHPDLKFVLNDNNNYLKEMYEIYKDENKITEFNNYINNAILPNIKEKEQYNKYIKENKNNLYGWYISNKYYRIRQGIFPINKTMIDTDLRKHDIYNFFKNANITYTSNDGCETYKLYKDNKEALIFFDPPYLISYNGCYENIDANIYEYLCNNRIDKEKSKIFLILEDIWIIKLLFKDNIKFSYDKKYETTKKKTQHLIISNQ